MARSIDLQKQTVTILIQVIDHNPQETHSHKLGLYPEPRTPKPFKIVGPVGQETRNDRVQSLKTEGKVDPKTGFKGNLHPVPFRDKPSSFIKN